MSWSKQFSTFCFLDNHEYQISPHTEECLLAAGIKRELQLNTGNAFDQLQEFIDQEPGHWLFGHLGYDLKNEIEALRSENPDGIGFPDCYFFEPEFLIHLNRSELIIQAVDPRSAYQSIMNETVEGIPAHAAPSIQHRFSKEAYIATIATLQQHILRGDCYEINFCQEFFAEDSDIDPVTVYQSLSNISPNPFSALYKMNDRWLICASPERYLRKEGRKILSQPIKGTAERITDDTEKDNQAKQLLKNSAKERSENVMVVDLVRNDLSRICEEGTVKVDELYGIYSFPQVHQMISTVSGELKKDISFTEMIKATFPMGSMTGAPKKRVMELIEQYERTRRGIFSGAVGYISASGDVDLNVVIRSIMYNAATKYLSFQAGSAITWYSEPEKEWEECLLKADAIKRVLGG